MGNHNGLTFNQLQDANIKRLPTYRNKKGIICHLPDGSDWSPAQWYQAFQGECGEYASWRKQYERGDIDEETFLKEGGKELADMQTYLDILAFRLGIDLGEATRDKFNKVSERVGSPIKLP